MAVPRSGCLSSVRCSWPLTSLSTGTAGGGPCVSRPSPAVVRLCAVLAPDTGYLAPMMDEPALPHWSSSGATLPFTGRSSGVGHAHVGDLAAVASASVRCTDGYSHTAASLGSGADARRCQPQQLVGADESAGPLTDSSAYIHPSQPLSGGLLLSAQLKTEPPLRPIQESVEPTPCGSPRPETNTAGARSVAALHDLAFVAADLRDRLQQLSRTEPNAMLDKGMYSQPDPRLPAPPSRPPTGPVSSATELGRPPAVLPPLLTMRTKATAAVPLAAAASLPSLSAPSRSAAGVSGIAAVAAAAATAVMAPPAPPKRSAFSAAALAPLGPPVAAAEMLDIDNEGGRPVRRKRTAAALTAPGSGSVAAGPPARPRSGRAAADAATVAAGAAAESASAVRGGRAGATGTPDGTGSSEPPSDDGKLPRWLQPRTPSAPRSSEQDQERQRRRRERNRISAQASRERRKQRNQELLVEMETLQQQKRELMQRIEAARLMNERLRQQLVRVHAELQGAPVPAPDGAGADRS